MKSVLSIFSFHGRMRRVPYGIFTLVSLPLCFVATLVFIVTATIAFFGLTAQTIAHLAADQQAASFLTAELNTNPQVAALLKTPMSNILPVTVTSALVLSVVNVAWLASAVRRLHDMNVTGWAVLALILVAGLPYAVANPGEWYAHAGASVVGLVLMFWPTSPGADRFGPDPRTPFAGDPSAARA